MKYIIIEQVGCVYWYTEDGLAHTHINEDNMFDTSDPLYADEEIVGEEPLPEPYGSCTTFSELYRVVERKLSTKTPGETGCSACGEEYCQEAHK